MYKEFVAFESPLRRSSYSTQESVLSSLASHCWLRWLVYRGTVVGLEARQFSGRFNFQGVSIGWIKNKRQALIAPAFDVLGCCGFYLRSDHMSARKCDPTCPRLALRTAKPHSLNHLASRGYEGIKCLAVEHVQIASNFFNAGHDFHASSSLVARRGTEACKSLYISRFFSSLQQHRRLIRPTLPANAISMPDARKDLRSLDS